MVQDQVWLSGLSNELLFSYNAALFDDYYKTIALNSWQVLYFLHAY